MKIVFVQPNVGYSGHTWEALGMGYIISCIKKNYSDIDIEFYSGFYDSDKTIIDACSDADIIGFGCSSPQFKHALSLINKIKCPSNLVVVGGIHPTALPYQPLKEKNIDVVVCGEGEDAMVSIIAKCKHGIPINREYHTGFIQNIDELPFPDRHTIKNERNIQQAHKDNNKRITSIISSRGCPYNCSFCCSHCMWGRKTRFRSPTNIMDEYEYLIKEWKIDFIKFADDTFTIDKNRVKEFCRMKYNRGYGSHPFLANAHINTIDETMLRYLSFGGCTELCFGVESGSPKILDDMHKHTDIDRIKKVFSMTKNHGIKTRAYFLLGMPNETIEDIHMTEELCDILEPDEVGFTLLAPFPDNEYFDFDTMKDWDWSVFDEYGNDWVHTDTLSNMELKREQHRLVEKYKKNISFVQRKRL